MSLFQAGSPHLRLSGATNNTITKVSNSFPCDSIYAKEWIASTTEKVFKWVIQNNHSSNYVIRIGFITNDHHQETYKDICDKGCYLYRSNGVISKDRKCAPFTAPKLPEGSVATLTLDLIKAQIRISIDNDKDHLLFQNIVKKTWTF